LRDRALIKRQPCAGPVLVKELRRWPCCAGQQPPTQQGTTVFPQRTRPAGPGSVRVRRQGLRPRRRGRTRAVAPVGLRSKYLARSANCVPHRTRLTASRRAPCACLPCNVRPCCRSARSVRA
jgi:hypothetical protein